MAYDTDIDEQDREAQDADSGRDDDALLDEIRSRFDAAMEYWGPIRDEADTDMRFLAGDAWVPAERTARTAGAPSEQRLCLSFDELNQNKNQVVNNFRQNKPAIKIDPKGNGADDKLAELRENMIRQIEYQSKATMAYTIAFDNAVSRSYGYAQVCRDYESPESNNQEIYIEPIANPNCVVPDPAGMKLDGSDWKYCYKIKVYTRDEFRREWPKAKILSFGPDLIRLYPQWFQDKTIQVAEYWKIHEERKRLLTLDTAIVTDKGPKDTIILEDYPDLSVKGKMLIQGKRPVAMILSERPTITKKLKQYVVNGVEILEENEQPGEYIPIVPFYGEEMWLNDAAGPRRIILSLIRLARDAQTAYSYVRTTQMELIGQIPKAPYIGYEGQFEGHVDEWNNVNRVRIPFLQAKATLEDTGPNTVLPLPQQTHYEPAIQALELKAEALRRAIQSAMGISPLPTNALRRNDKSGIALQQIETNQMVGSYHFMDNAKLSIAHIGRIINSWLAVVYDTPRDVGLRRADETFEMRKVVETDEETQQERKLLEMGEYEITVGTGPSYQSQREEASNFADLLVQNQQAFPILAPLAIKLKNLGPLGDQMAEMMEFLQPPELRQMENGGDPTTQMRQMMLQMQQENAQLKAALQEVAPKAQDNQVKLQTTEMQQQSEMQREQMRIEAEMASKRMEIESRERIAAAQNETTLAAKLMEKQSESNVTILNHEVQSIREELDDLRKFKELVLRHEQEKEVMALEHAQGQEKADADHARSLESQDVAHQQGLEAQYVAKESADTEQEGDN